MTAATNSIASTEGKVSLLHNVMYIKDVEKAISIQDCKYTRTKPVAGWREAGLLTFQYVPLVASAILDALLSLLRDVSMPTKPLPNGFLSPSGSASACICIDDRLCLCSIGHKAIAKWVIVII